MENAVRNCQDRELKQNFQNEMTLRVHMNCPTQMLGHPHASEGSFVLLIDIAAFYRKVA
jgi:hypothetical protein